MSNTNACRVLPLAMTLLSALPLAGCSGGGSNGGGSGPSAPAAPLSVSAVTPSGVTATLAEDKAVIPVNGGVTYTLTLVNNTTQTIYSDKFFEGPNGTSLVPGSVQIIDATENPIPVPTSGGQTGVPTGATMVGITLAPGQSVSGSFATGNIFSTAGQYTATATFLTSSSVPATTSTAVGPLTVTVQ